MDSNDLVYLLKNNTYKTKNIYEGKIITSTSALHINFLKNSGYKYKIHDTKRKYLKKIDVLRVDGSLVATVLNPNYPNNALIGRELTNDKIKTERHLRRFNIGTPNSRLYNDNDIDIAYEESFAETKKNIVIKPLASSLGRGVRVNVSQKRFKHNWSLAVNDIKEKDKRIVVQNYLEGFEARATVINGQLLSIIVRIPPYVIGDGQNTISELIDLKNKDRMKCSYLSGMLIKKSERIEEFLLSHGLDSNYIPDQNEPVLLNSVSNVAQGGELMDITNIVTDEIKEKALNALAAIPGVLTGGLDIMMKSFDDSDPKIIEINTYPVFSIPTYLTYGQGKNTAKEYFQSLIEIEQLIHNPDYKYNIKNEEDYIRAYVSFMERKNKLLKSYKHNLEDIIFK